MNITPVFDAGNPAYKALIWSYRSTAPESPICPLRWSDSTATADSLNEWSGGIHATADLLLATTYLTISSGIIARVCPVPPYVQGESGWRASGAVITEIVAWTGDRRAYAAMRRWARRCGLPVRWRWPRGAYWAILADGITITHNKTQIDYSRADQQTVDLLVGLCLRRGMTRSPQAIMSLIKQKRHEWVFSAIERLSRMWRGIESVYVDNLHLSDIEITNQLRGIYAACHFRNVVIRGIGASTFTDCTFENCTFPEMTRVSFYNCQITDSSIRGNLKTVSFERCTLTGTTVTGKTSNVLIKRCADVPDTLKMTA